MDHERTIEHVKKVFGTWEHYEDMGRGAVQRTIQIIAPIGRNVLLQDGLEILFDVIEREEYESPLFVMDNQVFMGFVLADFRGIQLENVLPSGKDGMLMGYPFFSSGRLSLTRDECFLGVVDRGLEPKGSYMHYSISR